MDTQIVVRKPLHKNRATKTKYHCYLPITVLRLIL